jgi:predicted nuclease of predicted toxin-antitoxin system
MRFLLDAQLPPALCRWLADKGHEANHITEFLPGETPDILVADQAIRDGSVLLTKDDDFALRHQKPRLVVIWVRIGNAGNRALFAWLEPRWAEIMAALEAGETLIEVV